PISQPGAGAASSVATVPGGGAARRGRPAAAGAGVPGSHPGGGRGWMRSKQGGGWQGRGRNAGGRRDEERPRGRFRDRQGPSSPRRETPRDAAPRPQKAAEAPLGARLIGVEELEVRIEKLVAGGEGLARVSAVPVFVPRSAPGDLLRVRIVERRPDYGRAEILEILEPGPGRRPDPVPELSGSGVCDLQHLDDRVQPILKAEAVRETLQRLGHVAVPGGSP